MITKFQNAKILKNHAITREDLWIAKNKIIPPQKYADIIIDAYPFLIAPGYIDLQINGAYGCDFSSDVGKMAEVRKKLPCHGVTSFLPTVVTSTREKYLRLLPQLQPQEGGEKGASILGIHLEGPFLNPAYAGAHSSNEIRDFSKVKDLIELYGSLSGVKMVTLAPELPRALSFISFLKSQGILVSAGHTGATFEQMEEALFNGLGMVTHLFNAMDSFHHRHPGVIGAALSRSTCYYSLISDEVHLHPATIKLAYKCHPQGLILISDASAALGMERGTFPLGKNRIEIENQKCCLKGTTTLSGSILGLDAMVRNFQKLTQCSVIEALEAASLRPAQAIGAFPKKGTLEVGSDADLILLNEKLEVQACYVNGHSYSSRSS